MTLENEKTEKKILIDNSSKKYTYEKLNTTITEIKKDGGINSFLDVDEKLF